jgi:carbonic anhydrase
VVINEFTDTDPGDIFTRKNIGKFDSQQWFQRSSVLQYAVEYLKVEHILVIGHTDCGAVIAALSDTYHGLIDHWLKGIREIAEKYVNELDLVEKGACQKTVRKLIELNIREQCLSSWKNPIIQKAWDSGPDLYIHGYLFEMESGKLIDLEDIQKDWSQIQDIYKFNFKKK